MTQFYIKTYDNFLVIAKLPLFFKNTGENTEENIRTVFTIFRQS